jgi:hypothetical protein
MSYDFFIKYINENINKDPDDIYNELKSHSNIEILNFIMLDKFNYIYTKKETTEEKEKRLDTEYKNKVKQKYNNICMVTNKIIDVCQVAHIFSFKDSNNEERYDPENGFLLSAELHLLFDNSTFKFKIDPDTSIMTFSDEILNNPSMKDYHQYHNKKINLSEKNKYYLKKKYS